MLRGRAVCAAARRRASMPTRAGRSERRRAARSRRSPTRSGRSRCGSRPARYAGSTTRTAPGRRRSRAHRGRSTDAAGGCRAFPDHIIGGYAARLASDPRCASAGGLRAGVMLRRLPRLPRRPGDLRLHPRRADGQFLHGNRPDAVDDRRGAGRRAGRRRDPGPGLFRRRGADRRRRRGASGQRDLDLASAASRASSSWS